MGQDIDVSLCRKLSVEIKGRGIVGLPFNGTYFIFILDYFRYLKPSYKCLPEICTSLL